MTTSLDKAVADGFRSKGWAVLDSGWPDLLCYDKRTSAAMAVELKRGSDRLRPSQIEMASVFNDVLRVPFYVAREGDVEAVIRKKGRVALPGKNVEALKSTVSYLQKSIADAERQLRDIAKVIDETSVVFALEPEPRPLSGAWFGFGRYGDTP